jgi:hypothetical protein
MEKEKRNFILEMAGFICSLSVVLISAMSMAWKVNRPQLFGLIAGSFGAGASLANTIRNHSAKRKKGGT